MISEKDLIAARSLTGEAWAEAMLQIMPSIFGLEDSRERAFLISYFCNGNTVAEIADRYGLSWKQTHRILKQATQKLCCNKTNEEIVNEDFRT